MGNIHLDFNEWSKKVREQALEDICGRSDLPFDEHRLLDEREMLLRLTLIDELKNIVGALCLIADKMPDND